MTGPPSPAGAARSGPGLDETGRPSAVDDGVITGIGAAAGAGAARRRDRRLRPIVTPGLIDLHTHLYDGVTHYGVDRTRTACAAA